MRVTQILTKTQVYEHEHPAYANAPLATYMHTYSLSLILSVCPSVRLSLTLTPVGIKGGLLQRPSHPFKPFAHITNADVRQYHVTRACFV